MFSRLVKQFSEKEGVTETLKAEKPNALGTEKKQLAKCRYGNRINELIYR